jgi:hypothetical protein
MIYLSIWIARLLVAFGVDLECLCSHLKSKHDFDPPTETGFCQSGSWRDGCNCCAYEPRGLRPADPDRHVNGIV